MVEDEDKSSLGLLHLQPPALSTEDGGVQAGCQDATVASEGLKATGPGVDAASNGKIKDESSDELSGIEAKLKELVGVLATYGSTSKPRFFELEKLRQDHLFM